jgi:hypothetical protein
VKAVVLVLVPPTVVTETVTETATVLACEGTLAVILVPPVETTTVVAEVPLKSTELAPVKWVPTIVTDVPPLVGPAEGVTRVIVGAETYEKPVALV